MEIYKNKAEMEQKMKFPHYQNKGGITAFFAYLLGLLIWFLVLIGALIALYAHWFRRSLIYLLGFLQKQTYVFPFWLALLLTVVVFPFTLFVILTASLVKIIKNS